MGSESSFEELLARVESAAAGELVCPPRIASALLHQAAIRTAWDPGNRDSIRLTSRELDVLRLLHHGLSNQEIACRLSISIATVKNHVHHLLEKLGAHSRGEAAAAGWRLGLLQTDASAVPN